MFGYNHYVPILRWRSAEIAALRFLIPEYKQSITPLIELVHPIPQRKPKDPAKVNKVIKSRKKQLWDLVTIFPHTVDQVWGHTPLFLDVSNLDADEQSDVLTSILNMAEFLRVKIIPVVQLNSNVEVIKIAALYAKTTKLGLCLRIYRDSIEGGNIENELKQLLDSTELKEEEVDLLFDYKITEESDYKLEKVELNLVKWRTFILASGCFVEDLSNMEPGKNEHKRLDWELWLKLIKNSDKRIPAFSDYTIQYPFVKNAPGGGSPSASIRYTLDKIWIIWRGRSATIFGFEQYIANAALLSKMPDFYGKDFSYGDAYIQKFGNMLKENDLSETGNPTTWLTAGINHHLSVVARQIDALAS